MPKRFPISIIIPALNEEKYLSTVLKSLKKQTFKDFETIVSDNGSTDKTGQVARSFRNVKVVLEKRRGTAINRNTGARAAHGDILIFLDADTKASDDLVEVYQNAFKEPGVVAATGPILPLEKTTGEVSLGYRFVSILFVKLTILLGRPSVVGINFAVRRNAFRKVGGFNEKFVTYEDYDLSLRLRKEGRIAYLDKAVVYSSVRRIKAWGMFGFFVYHVGNIFRYTLFKKPNTQYDTIR